MRHFASFPWILLAVSATAGCGPGSEPDLVWGRRGVLDGDLVRPRAAAILPTPHGERLYVVDFTARIQAYDLDGNYVGPSWTTPDFRNGRPSGLGVTRDGNLIVCDSHYHAVGIYAADGTPLRRFGGPDSPPGFGYVSDCVQDADGFFYVAEFSSNERITKLDESGNLVATWGEFGSAPGQFNRPRALAIGPDDGLLYVADACNHRIQVFTRDGVLVRAFGEPGEAPGQVMYPYDLAFSPRGHLYVTERGNNRVQKFSPAGESLGVWGGPGRGPGRFASPWALALDGRGRAHVIDTENHRVQRVRF